MYGIFCVQIINVFIGIMSLANQVDELKIFLHHAFGELEQHLSNHNSNVTTNEGVLNVVFDKMQSYEYPWLSCE